MAVPDQFIFSLTSAASRPSPLRSQPDVVDPVRYCLSVRPAWISSHRCPRGQRRLLARCRPRLSACSRHRTDLVEPDRERQIVSRPRAAPLPLHVGDLPHAADRISQASALQDRGPRVQRPETPQQLASHDHVRQMYWPGG